MCTAQTRQECARSQPGVVYSARSCLTAHACAICPGCVEATHLRRHADVLACCFDSGRYSMFTIVANPCLLGQRLRTGE